jgi:GTP-binding protein
MTATVAIVGRPNVGKSTLFNRLAGRKLALVDDRPGVTRDRREGDARLGGLHFRIIDTAGLDEAAAGSLAARMSAQTERGIAEADVCLFMIDARAGLTPLDRHFAGLVRRAGKPVILIANKAEGGAGKSGLYEAYALGLGEPVALSAEHGEGLGELYDRLEAAIAAPQAWVDAGPDGGEGDEEEADARTRPLRLAILGRPNAGKSTLVNALVGEERMLTGPEPGITRDAIALEWRFEGKPVTLWDTAGLRRKSRVNEKLEKLAVSDALRAVRFAEVVVLVLDAAQALEKQDLQLVDHAAREGRAVVIVINKWDLVEDRAAARRDLDEAVATHLPQITGVPVVYVSGLTGEGLKRLMAAVFKCYQVWNRRVPTSRISRWLEAMVERHPPPAPGGRRIRLRYMTQVSARPPTFAIFGSRVDALPESYKRYLVNRLREDFDLPGVPIRLHLRAGKNPYI